MKGRNFLAVSLVAIMGALTPLAVLGQGSLGNGTFLNLDFEQAELSALPSGQSGGPDVPTSQAIPGWTAYIGNAEVSTVSQDDISTGSAAVGIFGPKGGSGMYDRQVLQDLYSISLQAGAGGAIVVPTAVSIAQTGVVPSGASTLLFSASMSTPCVISLGGQSLPVIALGAGPNYTLYGAPIPSSMAGQLETLQVTASPSFSAAPNVFDAFSFSPEAIPEPSVAALLGIGALSLFAGRRAKRA